MPTPCMDAQMTANDENGNARQEFWGVGVDEESGLVYGPFKHAFQCMAKYVSAA